MSRSTAQRTALQERGAHRAAETRALYRYELQKFRDGHLLQVRSMQELRRLTAQLWAAESHRPRALPVVVAGRGVYQAGRWLSYCQGRQIVLARHERNYLVLIHELTHALGFTTHGVGFRRRYFGLLQRHGGPLSESTRAALAVNLRTLA